MKVIKTHLSRARVQESDVLVRLYAHQATRVALPDLNELGLKRQNVLFAPRGKGVGRALPQDLPVTASAPAVLIDVEAEVGVTQQELRGVALDVDGLDAAFATGDKVERSVCLVEQGLSFQGLQ